MAIIELNLEKPALKRVESVEEKQVEEEQIQTEVDTEEAREMAREMTSESAETTEQSGEESGGKSRIRKYGRRMAILGGTAAGVAAARKLRQRRKGSAQQELEEDWQTADTTGSSESP